MPKVIVTDNICKWNVPLVNWVRQYSSHNTTLYYFSMLLIECRNFHNSLSHQYDLIDSLSSRNRVIFTSQKIFSFIITYILYVTWLHIVNNFTMLCMTMTHQVNVKRADGISYCIFNVILKEHQKTITLYWCYCKCWRPSYVIYFFQLTYHVWLYTKVIDSILIALIIV